MSRTGSCSADSPSTGTVRSTPSRMASSGSAPAGQLVRFDTRQFVRSSSSFPALIRRVAVNQATAHTAGEHAAECRPPSLSPSSTALRFEFAAPSFLNERATQYQSRLDGLDADWSEWSGETRRDYTNLGFGDYAFRVRARNELTQVSEEGVFAFTILPPWYRTWWAYALYLARPRGAGDGGGWRAAPARRLQGTLPVRDGRGADARRVGRSAGHRRARAHAEHRVAQRHRPRNHVVARPRHHLRQAVRACEPARRRRCVRRRTLRAGREGDRVPARDRERQALRAVHARRQQPQPVSGLVHRASAAGVHQRRQHRVQPLYREAGGRLPQARGRVDVPSSAVADLPAAHQPGPRPRRHHHPELREKRLHASIT